ncbi:hypothetical protein [Xanthomonas melonis]|uniref:hypothetical protein n=1 Tax=Xanthomonas melonis TaxID=56456 RepID=UPI003EBDB75E
MQAYLPVNAQTQWKFSAATQCTTSRNGDHIATEPLSAGTHLHLPAYAVRWLERC